jgi:hypothetical protein
MFLTDRISMLLAKATLKLEKNDKGELYRVADLSLVLEPFPYELAAELDDAILSHLFNTEKQIRPELQDITLNPRAGHQAIIVSSAPDAPALVRIRNAKILDLTVVKQTKTERQWLKATLAVRIDLSERAIREFLFHHFGEYRLFSFIAEQGDVLAEVRRDFVRDMRKTMGPDDGVTSIELSTEKDGRRVGTKITKDAVEPIDEPIGKVTH